MIELGLPQINILEIGFGTGLNAFLSYLESKKNINTCIDYHGVEAYPISKSEYQSLNYHEHLSTNHAEFLLLHEAPWNEKTIINESFSLTKHNTTFEQFESSNLFDLIYFDAFAPGVQSHLWEVPFLSQIYKLCKSHAVLVTYCAKGSFKRALKTCGFTIESLPGPAKKREMTRARKSTIESE